MQTKSPKETERLELMVMAYEGMVNCSACGGIAVFGSNATIYNGREYGNGMAWICENFPKCDSYVGCHSDGKPLGTPANKELRTARNQCHQAFDPLWKALLPPGKVKGHQRSILYAKLAMYLGVPTTECHIGMFSLEQCQKTQEFIRDYNLGLIPNYVKNPNNSPEIRDLLDKTNPETSFNTLDSKNEIG